MPEAAKLERSWGGQAERGQKPAGCVMHMRPAVPSRSAKLIASLGESGRLEDVDAEAAKLIAACGGRTDRVRTAKL